MPFFAASEAPPRPESMKFPVFSLLAGNLAFSETSSQLTPPSSAESATNRPGGERHQVRIRVHAAGVNFADSLMVGGTYQVKPQFPFTPGLEAAGEIVETPAAPKPPKPNALRALYTASSKGLVRGVSGLLGGPIRNSGKVLAIYRRERLGLLELMQRVRERVDKSWRNALLAENDVHIVFLQAAGRQRLHLAVEPQRTDQPHYTTLAGLVG